MVSPRSSLTVPRIWRRKHLSLAEQRVVALICTGLPTKVAAAQLGKSTFTVRNQLNNAMRKLGVSSRYELIVQLRTAAVTEVTEVADSFVYTI